MLRTYKSRFECGGYGVRWVARAYDARMEFTDYMLWKLIGMAVLAFCWGLFCGITDRSMQTGRPNNPAELDQSSQEPASRR
jgi:hypothetical protein